MDKTIVIHVLSDSTSISSVRMFDKGCFGHVHSQLTDVRDVIADALDVLGDEEQPCGARRGARIADHQINKGLKDTVVKIIYLVIGFDDGASGGGIAGSKGVKPCA